MTPEITTITSKLFDASEAMRAASEALRPLDEGHADELLGAAGMIDDWIAGIEGGEW